MKKLLSLLILLCVSCMITKADTVPVFRIVRLKTDKLLSFDDNNALFIKGADAKLLCTEESESNYTLTVKVKNKVILTKKHIKGITKILYENGYLMFSVFTYSDEDANNEGYGYIVNTKDNSVKFFSHKLKNTCNPIIINNAVYFVNGLTLLKTDMNMSLQGMVVIAYQSKDKRYLDTYSISGLSDINDLLTIDFAADRYKGKSDFYCGKIDNNTKFIKLQ